MGSPFAGPRNVTVRSINGSRIFAAFEVTSYAHARRLGDVLSGRRQRLRRRVNAVRAVLRQEQDPLRSVRLAHLCLRSFRDLLLLRARAPSRTDRRVRRKRVSAGQLRSEARSLGEGAAY